MYFLQEKFYERLSLFFVALGVMTRILLYIQNPNLSLDDCMLSASMWTISWSDIFAGHLPYNQSAPLGFLAVTRALTVLFGDSEFVLRFLPLLFGIGILPLAYYFMQREFGVKTACIFLFLLVCSDVLLCYSVQFKQYGIEAFMAIAFLALYSHFRKEIEEQGNISWKLILAAIAGTQFSNTSFFVLFGIFAVILTQHKIPVLLKKNWHKLLLFAIYSALYYCLWQSQIDAVKSGYMKSFWQPFYLQWNKDDIDMIKNIFVSYFSFFMDFTSVHFLDSLIFISLFFGGLIILHIRKNFLFLPLLTIFILAICLYIFRFYPLFCFISSRDHSIDFIIPRTSLYLIPLTLIPVAVCMEKIISNIRAGFLSLTIFGVIAVFAVYQNFERIEKGIHLYEISDFITKINEIPNENKIVIMYALDEPAYLYYQHIMASDSGDVYIIQDNFVDIDCMPHTKLNRHIIVDTLELNKEFVIFLFNRYVETNLRSNIHSLINEYYKNEHLIFKTENSIMLILHNSASYDEKKIILF